MCEKLCQNKIDVDGFYTIELRNESRSRIGFDVVTLSGKQSKLARVRWATTSQFLFLKDCTVVKHYKHFDFIRDLVQTNEITRFSVGQYVVFPKEFEKLVMPLFSNVSKMCHNVHNSFHTFCYWERQTLPKFLFSTA